RRGLDLPDNELPRGRPPRELPPQLNLLGQFLSSALGSICREADLATSLVGGPNDVRELVAYRLGMAPADEPPPALAQGWRAEVVGSLIDDLLAGKIAISISNPKSEQPLKFERR